MPLKIAIQGFEGSFHQAAAKHFFGEAETISCTTFREVIKVSENKKVSDGGIMAIENSIAGSILPNYTLIQKSNLKIVGEIYLHIRQHLLVNPGIKIEDIREVHSHPIALLQCIEFLDKQHWKLVETDDTALSAKHVHQTHSRHIAAVAGKLAAELYGLEILVPNIQTMKNNYTRFLVLKRKGSPEIESEVNKASVNFFTDHSRGSLAKVLTLISKAGINLSKLQSVPIAGSDWKYSFHADMEFENRKQFEKAIAAITPFTEELNILGTYKKGITV
ncbi:MAG: prephenate dehydratase [Ginsengibacter sp.]